MKELEPIVEHKFKRSLRYFSINQQVLSKNLGITQPRLANMLSGYVKMPEKIESEIQELLDFRKFKEKEQRKKKR